MSSICILQSCLHAHGYCKNLAINPHCSGRFVSSFHSKAAEASQKVSEFCQVSRIKNKEQERGEEEEGGERKKKRKKEEEKGSQKPVVVSQTIRLRRKVGLGDN